MWSSTLSVRNSYDCKLPLSLSKQPYTHRHQHKLTNALTLRGPRATPASCASGARVSKRKEQMELSDCISTVDASSPSHCCCFTERTVLRNKTTPLCARALRRCLRPKPAVDAVSSLFKSWGQSFHCSSRCAWVRVRLTWRKTFSKVKHGRKGKQAFSRLTKATVQPISAWCVEAEYELQPMATGGGKKTRKQRWSVQKHCSISTFWIT